MWGGTLHSIDLGWICFSRNARISSRTIKLRAVAIKRKREDECNEEWKETEMKQLSRNEDNEERKDECKFNHNASEGGMVRVTTEDVIVIQPTSPIVAEQV